MLSSPIPKTMYTRELSWHQSVTHTDDIGSFLPLELVWRLGDISNAAMALPNIVALLALSGVVFAIARGNRAAGKDHGRETPNEFVTEATIEPGDGR
jgi:AGCS family alanine or glycine:cation symporter